MDVIISQWALDSYLDLKHNNTFSEDEYQNKIRPDVLLLRAYPAAPKFQNAKFWSQATDNSKQRIPDGFKMKWHNVGNGKVQLRLPVGIFSNAFLCGAYVKTNDKEDKRRLAKFKVHLELIRKGRHTERGRLK